jgi:hypothetical protein
MYEEPLVHWGAVAPKKKAYYGYSRTPLIWINWEDEPYGYVENPDNWIFLCK